MGVVGLLKAQIQILRSRIDASRIVPNPAEKAVLLRLDAQQTHRKWIRCRQELGGIVKSDNREAACVSHA